MVHHSWFRRRTVSLYRWSVQHSPSTEIKRCLTHCHPCRCEYDIFCTRSPYISGTLQRQTSTGKGTRTGCCESALYFAFLLSLTILVSNSISRVQRGCAYWSTTSRRSYASETFDEEIHRGRICWRWDWDSRSFLWARKDVSESVRWYTYVTIHSESSR